MRGLWLKQLLEERPHTRARVLERGEVREHHDSHEAEAVDHHGIDASLLQEEPELRLEVLLALELRRSHGLERHREVPVAVVEGREVEEEEDGTAAAVQALER